MDNQSLWHLCLVRCVRLVLSSWSLKSSSNTVPALLPAIVALLISIVFGVCGQLLLKHAAGLPVQDLSALLSALCAGIAVYSLGVISWMVALRRISLTVAYPLTSLNYVGILLGAQYWFGEQLSVTRLIGVAMIFAGVMCVALGARDRERLANSTAGGEGA